MAAPASAKAASQASINSRFATAGWTRASPIDRGSAIRQKASGGKFEVAVPWGLKDTKSYDPIKSAAFVDLVHTVANSNDFAYRF